MKNYKLDLERYAVLARQATAEGCVLLENEGQALPLREGERVAVFGRCGDFGRIERLQGNPPG